MTTTGFTVLGFAAALLFGGAAFFFIKWAMAWRVEAKKTELEKRRERIDAEARAMSRESAGKQLRTKLASWGWEGDLPPLLLGSTMVYLLVVITLGAIGVPGFAAFAAGLPVSLLTVGLVNQASRNRRQRAFNRQLMQALDLFAAQLKGGLSAVRAMEQVLPSLPQPLRGELAVALEQHRAARPLGDALADVQKKYPSRAMQMLVVSIRIDEERGGKMANALEQAAENVRRDFELGAEAQAELSQEKAQFYGILSILGLFAFLTIGRADEAQRAAYFHGGGLFFLILMSANLGFGIFRVLRTMSKARGQM